MHSKEKRMEYDVEDRVNVGSGGNLYEIER